MFPPPHPFKGRASQKADSGNLLMRVLIEFWVQIHEAQHGDPLHFSVIRR